MLVPDPRTRGDDLVESLSEPNDPPSLMVLVVEAGRIADRLDALDEILSGETDVWVRLADARDGDIVVRVDSALTEARQQALALRQLLIEIDRRRGPVSKDDNDPLDDL